MKSFVQKLLSVLSCSPQLFLAFRVPFLLRIVFSSAHYIWVTLWDCIFSWHSLEYWNTSGRDNIRSNNWDLWYGFWTGRISNSYNRAPFAIFKAFLILCSNKLSLSIFCINRKAIDFSFKLARELNKNVPNSNLILQSEWFFELNLKLHDSALWHIFTTVVQLNYLNIKLSMSFCHFIICKDYKI